MNNRRSFLQRLGLLTAGVAFAPSLLTSCEAAGRKTETAAGATAEAAGAENPTSAKAEIKDIGIQLYTMRQLLPKDVKGVIARVAQAGYNDVETYGYAPDSGYWKLSPKAFREVLDANSLTSSSGHYEFGQYMKDGNTDVVKRYIEASKAVGQTYITVPWLDAEVRTKLDDYKRIANLMNVAAQLCQDAGLKLAYHNHDFEFQKFGNTTGYEVLLQETDPGLVSFEADLYWVVRAGLKPVDLFRQHQGRFVMWHVKDMNKQAPELNTEVGSGSINYQEIFRQAKLSGVERIFVEQENFAAAMDPYKSIRQSRDYVKNTLLA
ncbi:sugar phosphate isomerase/epimerase family protein [Rufibacter ruber]|uniref:sugar phosphate isomerase/epimerase family protein n=1 Tax=Rufibacter ruber TaxID=1783499 RepID=UPI0008315878|nr:sugar phosphate isomerase/epimerase [Rufibacter ruber]